LICFNPDRDRTIAKYLILDKPHLERVEYKRNDKNRIFFKNRLDRFIIRRELIRARINLINDTDPNYLIDS
jgi:hypothetical protein